MFNWFKKEKEQKRYELGGNKSFQILTETKDISIGAENLLEAFTKVQKDPSNGKIILAMSHSGYIKLSNRLTEPLNQKIQELKRDIADLKSIQETDDKEIEHLYNLLGNKVVFRILVVNEGIEKFYIDDVFLNITSAESKITELIKSKLYPKNSQLLAVKQELL